ncbi:MAG: hypothetical protein FJW39_07670 [Acidobacteria bacterium]|nr:hypothetical protein [Acidobacteriota bacterium]
MKRICTFILTALSMVALAAGAGFDGTWTAEVKARGKKGGEAKSGTATLVLKTEQGKLTGSYEAKVTRKPKAAEIQNAKVDGNKLTFDTVLQTKKKGAVTTQWEATLDGDQLTLTPAGKGKRAASVTFKRQS